MFAALLLCLHLLAATWWVGGMAVMHFAVRPAAAQLLEPPLRLPFMAAVLRRFFAGVSAAVAVLLASGLGLIALHGGFGQMHWSVHTMLAIGLLMTGVYAHVRLGLYPRLQQAIAARAWPAAAAQLNAIRQRVALNLALGTLVYVLALAGRGF